MTQKNGILKLYVSHATAHIAACEHEKRITRISRSRVELQLLAELDKAHFPIEYKMAWYNAILTSSTFEAFWLSTSLRLKLPPICIKRYTPDPSLLEYDSFSTHDSEDISSPPSLTSDHETPSVSNATPAPETTPEDNPFNDPEAIEFARRLGLPRSVSPEPEEPHIATSSPATTFDTRALLGDPNGLGREEGDDGGWGHSKKKTRGKALAKPKTPKVAKAKAPPKERKTPANGGAAHVRFAEESAKRGVAAMDGGADCDGDEVATGTPIRKAQKTTPREKKPSVKARAVAAEG